MKKQLRLFLMMATVMCGLVVLPASAVVDAKISQHIRESMSQARPDLNVESVELSPLAGIYQVQIEQGPMLYVDAEGKYFIAGDLFAIQPDGFVNLQEIQRQKMRVKLLETVPTAEKIIYTPPETRSFITVFTDIDCGYCRKLHQEVPDLLARGIEVRYLAYPRAGINTESYRKIVTAWCSKDRQTTLTKLKRGETVAENSCPDNPVARHFALGDKLGVRGTPAIVLPDGTLLPGYLPADQLAKALGLE